jgi:hypothetical protein
MEHRISLTTRQLILLIEACQYASAPGSKFDYPERSALSDVSRLAEGALASSATLVQ